MKQDKMSNTQKEKKTIYLIFTLEFNSVMDHINGVVRKFNEF